MLLGTPLNAANLVDKMTQHGYSCLQTAAALSQCSGREPGSIWSRAEGHFYGAELRTPAGTLPACLPNSFGWGGLVQGLLCFKRLISATSLPWFRFKPAWRQLRWFAPVLQRGCSNPGAQQVTGIHLSIDLGPCPGTALPSLVPGAQTFGHPGQWIFMQRTGPRACLWQAKCFWGLQHLCPRGWWSSYGSQPLGAGCPGTAVGNYFV